jgi:NADH-quinone oxidoreductase subunit A
VSDYLPILVMSAVVIAFVMLSFIASQFLAPSRPNSAKQAPYECGIVPELEPPERFPVKFYLVAMSFIVLDVEIVFLYPFATVFRGLGLYGLLAMAVFLLVLLVPFAYLLSVGALDWGPARRRVEQFAGPLLRTNQAVFDPTARASDNDEKPDEEAA